MKIGILTLPLHTNYGGILQAYALQTVLEKMGHEVEIFDKKKIIKKTFGKLILSVLFRAVKKTLFLYKGPLLIEREKEKAYTKSQVNTRRFVDSYLHICPIEDIKDIHLHPVDCIVVGSDQIWRPRYFKNISRRPADMFLAFTDGMNIKRISYAASFGCNEWELNNDETTQCAKYAQKFNMLSVREDSGIRLCQNFLGVTPEHVLDPTMLLSRNDYLSIVHDINIPCHSLVSYILDDDEEKNAIVKGLSLKYGNVYPLYHHTIPAPSVETWIGGLTGAKRMITDSFHGTAFSINFNIPFVVLSNRKRGQGRLVSILKMFYLEKRMVSTASEAKKVMEEPIDWETVNRILASQRQQSMNYLSRI